MKKLLINILNYFNLVPISRVKNVENKYEILKSKMLWNPGHYYSPIHEINDLPKSIIIDYNEQIPGIDLNENAQLALVEELKDYYSASIFPTNKEESNRYYFDNDLFGYSDGIFLAAMLCHFKPNRIIEIGSGYSSALMLDINEKRFNNKMQLKFIEPYPEERLSNLISSNDNCTIIKDFVQNTEANLWQELEKNDILFIDSSHVSKYASDVNYLFFDVLPKLKSGVIIHVHDIFFPFEYPLEWLKQGRSWNEAYLLRAFLQFNREFEIILFTSFLEGKYSEWFKQNMPQCLTIHKKISVNSHEEFIRTTGQSIYIRKK